ncbi:MAG: 6,7-dimethyl-8-ribityllumazine synthase [Burkholderiaceae bacterium]|nr:6,7-dimethyl-8-ribityllumazine synthase [Burkholderiaceae bacterium]
MSVEVFQAEPDGEGLRIGIVQARFNGEVCDTLRKSCLAELKRHGIADEDVFVCTVPGALEIPLALQQLAQTREFDALIAIGAVIRGETYHFEVVSNESCSGVSRVSLEFGIPIANAILTTENDAQAEVRAVEKGGDAARVAIEMANLGESLAELASPPEDAA